MRRKLAIGAVIVSLLFLQAQNAYALNKVNNWDFNGNSTGWTSTNGSGTDASPSCSATGSFGGDVSLTGGTTYTIRVTLQAKTKANSNTAITVGVDNVAVNLAPTGLSAS